MHFWLLSLSNPCLVMPLELPKIHFLFLVTNLQNGQNFTNNAKIYLFCCFTSTILVLPDVDLMEIAKMYFFIRNLGYFEQFATNPHLGTLQLDNLANCPKNIWSSQSIVLHIHTSPIFQSKIQLKSNIPSIFDAINFQHFLEMLEIMLQNFQNHQLLISSILMHWILAFLEIL